MNILQRIKSAFEQKSFSLGGFELLKRAFGQEWGDKNYLETYSKSATVYACVSKIAEKVGSVSFKLNRIVNAEGDIEEVKVHEGLDLLYKWNPFYTKEEAMETDVINRKLSGDSYILKIRNEQGTVAELWNIRPDLVTIIPDDENYIKEYRIRKDSGEESIVASEDMIHIKYPSPLEEYLGMSPLMPGRNQVNIEQYGFKYQSDFFINNARPDAVLETESNLNQTQIGELRAGWEKQHKGLGKNSKLGILGGGLKYHQISLSQREMDYIESMRFTRDEILMLFKVPKPILGVGDSVGRSRAEAETLQEIFLSETILPEINRFVNKINEQLIIPEFGEEYFISYEDPVPVNREQRLAEFNAGVDRWITANEIRQELGLESIPGGDSLYRPLGMQEAGQRFVEEEKKYTHLHGKRKLKTRFSLEQHLKTIEKSFTSISQASLFQDKNYRKMYYDYTMKALDRETIRFKNAMIRLKNEQKNDILKRFRKEQPKTRAEIRKVFNIKGENKRFKDWAIPYYATIFKEAGQNAISLVRVDMPFNMEKSIGPSILKLLSARAGLFAYSVNKTTLKAMQKTLAEGIEAGEGINKLEKRIDETYLAFNDYRAETIARTETNAVMNEANTEAYKQASMEGKEWIATLDDRVRDEHLLMDGEIVGVNENFSNGLPFPSDINCRCAIAPVPKIV
jgi:HK97 family phage portal protein